MLTLFLTLFLSLGRHGESRLEMLRADCSTFMSLVSIVARSGFNRWSSIFLWFGGRSLHWALDWWASASFPAWNNWIFPKIGVPQNGWFIMENPIKMDDLGVPSFLETAQLFQFFHEILCPRLEAGTAALANWMKKLLEAFKVCWALDMIRRCCRHWVFP